MERKLVELYLSNVELLNDGVSPVLSRQRQTALEPLQLTGIPAKGSGNGDRYHYTDVRSVFDADFEHYFTPSYRDVRPQPCMLDAYPIVLVNGFCTEAHKLTVAPNGIIYGSLAAAALRFPDLVSQAYGRIAADETDFLSALTALFVQEGTFVYVPKGVKANRPFCITYAQTAENESLAVFGRNLFLLEDEAQADIFLDYQTIGNERLLSCQTREVFVGRGAHVTLTELYRRNKQSDLLSGSYVRQGAESVYNSMSLALDGRLVRSNQTVYLDGEDAENHTYGLSLAGAGQHIDFATDICHNQPKCQSFEHFKGIAAHEGTSVFSGRIYVAPDAQETQAFQQNNSLMLTDDAHIYTKPQLEIYADNVKCSHGATVGQLDAEAIYYMRQRGIGLEEARRLQLQGFVRDILMKISLPEADQWLDELTLSKIDTL